MVIPFYWCGQTGYFPDGQAVAPYVCHPLFHRPSHYHAAAGMEILSRQPPRLVAHDECHDIRNILRRAESLERRGLFADLTEGGIGREHIRRCVSGRDRIYGDPHWGKFVCEAFRELFQCPLAAEVRGGARKADMGAIRRNVHDASTFLDDLRRFLQRKIRSLSIEGEHAVE